MRIKRIKIQNWTVLIICLIYTIVFYGIGYRVNYQPDIYTRVNAPHSYYTNLLKTDVGGRIVSDLIWWILRWGNFKFYYYLALFLAIVIMTTACYRYGLFLIRKLNYENGNLKIVIIITILSCITIENIFSAEYLIYADGMVDSTLGIFLSVEATMLFASFLNTGGKSKLCKAGALLLIVSFIYEIFPSVFLIMTLPFIMLYSSSILCFLKNQLFAGALYLAGILPKTVYTTFIIDSSRAKFDQNSFSDSVVEYLPSGKTSSQFILSRITFGMWGYAIVCLFIGMSLLVVVVRRKQYLEVIKGIYISMVTVAVALIPFILRLSSDYKPRIYYPLGMLFGVLITYGIMIKAFNLNSNMDTSVCTIVIAAYMVIQWFSFLQMYTDCYITNYEDQYISRMIGECIDNYEKESGDAIKYVTFYDDSERTKYCINGWNLTKRAYSSWGSLSALNYWLKKDYLPGYVDKELTEYYIEQNWDVFSEDQITFKGDTAHICMY